ncbi:hypothetical protein SAMN04487930_101376 [Cytophaga hutchinsonii ATCC 33406]|nr:hypothetical protein SAMN04487930_101376 [Cytophaga hutchinsonii ATCC 33406]
MLMIRVLKVIIRYGYNNILLQQGSDGLAVWGRRKNILMLDFYDQ